MSQRNMPEVNEDAKAGIGMRIKKYCPVCSEQPSIGITDLILAVNKETGKAYLSCSRGACGYTEPLPEDVNMRLLGAATLPGFG